MFSIKNKIIPIFFIMSLYGCDNGSKETYIEKIDRFELNYAIDQVIDAEKSAESSVAALLPDFYYMNFMQYPVPNYLRSTHIKLGVDTSKINYTDLDWMSDIRQMDEDYRNSPVMEQSHHH